jgi:hypothetical protein
MARDPVVAIVAVDGIEDGGDVVLLAHEPGDGGVEGVGKGGGPFDVALSGKAVGKLNVSVLVLDLKEDDGSSLAPDVAVHDLEDFLNKSGHLVLESLVVGAQLDARNLVQPVREAAIVPL